MKTFRVRHTRTPNDFRHLQTGTRRALQGSERAHNAEKGRQDMKTVILREVNRTQTARREPVAIMEDGSVVVIKKGGRIMVVNAEAPYSKLMVARAMDFFTV